MVGFDDGFGDGQPQTHAACGTGAGLVGAVKPLEDMRQILLRDAHAGVADC